MRFMNVAIDGPAGAGKSTIAKACAKELGYIYVDTGAMYRGIALYMVDHKIRPTDIEAVKQALLDVNVTLRYEDGKQLLIVNGQDVSDRIRTPEVSAAASLFSAIPEVRKALLDLQHDIAEKNNVLMDGRDIGTVILPQAQVKIYLDASPEIRGKRRYDELVLKGESVVLEDIIEDVKQRDYQDMHRETSPLKKADDAIVVDSSYMTIEEVQNKIVSLVREKENA
ncbi:MAG: (d)CMP kinase [Lachnospiraceae bacterium]|nr:(d)CMP kinase [Lachnospiraceae bacterium]MDD7702814.1 (d)CMP kinase [Lachnospiraceae bacterium]MDY3302158.1 (d)CMP kinase [Lachnospiraceae bacterium]MEE3378913.1 (d)CMP kinase [Lachnospiraceae bacterium]MEE3432719.1 (d)CMP kinase [Lachnospiraceae bacterium]